MERVAIRPFILVKSSVSRRITCVHQPFSRPYNTQQQGLLPRVASFNFQHNSKGPRILRHGQGGAASRVSDDQRLKSTIPGSIRSAYARRQYSTVTATTTTSEQYQHQPQQTKSASPSPSSIPAISPPPLNDADIDTKIVAQAPVELSFEQRFLVNQVINNGKSVFFTGSAGTGKSVLLRQLIQELKEVYKPGQVAVTASTGIAACNIGGSTLHSFAGVGLGTGTVEQLLEKLALSKGARSRWKKVKVLIIDEISMIEGDLFDKLEEIARKMKRSEKPFGGIQLVITGEFFQLPPVATGSVGPDGPSPSITSSTSLRPRLHGSMSTTTVFRRGLNDQDEDDIAFLEGHSTSPSLDATTATAEAREPILCFDAKTWNQCIQYTLQLTEVFRQRDPKFIKMLTEMRHGELSEETCQIFQQLERTPEYPDDGIKATELFALRRQVDQANERHLAELPGPMYVYEPQDDGPLKHFMDRFCTASSRLKLKESAQVMLIKNLTPNLVNGSMGLVVGFQENLSYDEDTGTWNKSHFPIVRFQGEEYDLVVKPEEWKMEMPNGEVMASRIQVPLILAWAMSIHKSQGQTMSRLKVDMGKIFEAGQAYVALSRATSLTGLQVLNFNKRSILAHERVAEFYDKLNTVSELIELEATKKPANSRKKSSRSKRSKPKAPEAKLEVQTA